VGPGFLVLPEKVAGSRLVALEGPAIDWVLVDLAGLVSLASRRAMVDLF